MEHTSNETHIWGPPGCGKTTYISRQVQNAVAKYGDHKVLVTSFTKAAATELGMRNLPLPKDRVGTLHAHCYRALHQPVIAESKIDNWNRDHSALRLTPGHSDVDEMDPEFTCHTPGDELYGRMQILRARMEPRERWPPAVVRFSTAWEEWKQFHGLMDYTDLLESRLRDLGVAPGDPAVLIYSRA